MRRPSLARRIKRRWTLEAQRPPVSLKRQLRRAGDTAIDLSGKRVLITGASSGIGAAAARQFAAQGATVALVARREDLLSSIVADIRAAGGTAHAFVCDMSDMDAIDAMAEAVVAEVGGVDILINNAARSIARPMAMSLERWHDVDRVMQLNFFGPLRLTRALLPAMIERGDGHIINVATWALFVETMPFFGVYNSSKVALAQATSAIAKELRGKGVAATTLYYPLVKTPMAAPTEAFNDIPGLSAEEAGQWMIVAAQTRPLRIAPRISLVARLTNAISPSLGLSLLRFVGFGVKR